MWWWWPQGGPATLRIGWKCPRSTLMETILLSVLVLCGPVTRTWGAIVHLSVPRAVNVDQTNEAILDCQYDYSENLDDYLVVKWFLNNNEQPIYTWLPHSNSRDFHPLYESFIDKSYKFSAESYEVHRGIRFAHLHPNLTGIYLCSVWSKWGHFEERKPMTLYRTPNFVRFEVKSPSPSVVSIECDVGRVMRPAEVRLYRIEERHFTALDADITLVPMRGDRLQSATAMVRANYTLPSPTNSSSSSSSSGVLQFQCAVVYPNSGVNVTRSRLMLMRSGAVSGVFGRGRTWFDTATVPATLTGLIQLAVLCLS